ncbi:MAG: hypothetical protein ACRDUX_13885, partial [Mycobacterium sp.]
MNDDRQSKRGISVHFKLSSFDFMIGSAGGIQFRFTGSDNAFPSPREDVMLVTSTASTRRQPYGYQGVT